MVCAKPPRLSVPPASIVVALNLPNALAAPPISVYGHHLRSTGVVIGACQSEGTNANFVQRQLGDRRLRDLAGESGRRTILPIVRRCVPARQ